MVMVKDGVEMTEAETAMHSLWLNAKIRFRDAEDELKRAQHEFDLSRENIATLTEVIDKVPGLRAELVFK